MQAKSKTIFGKVIRIFKAVFAVTTDLHPSDTLSVVGERVNAIDLASWKKIFS